MCSYPFAYIPVVSLDPPFIHIDRENNLNTHSSLPLYHGNAPGNSLQGAIDWFNDPTSFEFPFQTRSQPSSRSSNPQVRLFQFYCECSTKMIKMEQLIIGRCLPAPYRKDVGKTSPMYIAQMDPALWDYFLSIQPPPDTHKVYTHTYPDRGFKRRENFHTVKWSNGILPNLHTPHWFFVKWFQNGYVFRGYVDSLTLIWNEYSGMIRCEFTYKTWYWNPYYNNWIYC